ncbi:Pao retrotransposon peptidase family protein [Aphelenchoides avenae]|nr:Pao retrotransposon peptidase family protein [Aphelenchus avenae]
MHLMDHLQGEPHELCSQFATTDENYKEVLEFLDQRYGEEDFIVAELLQKLRQIPRPEYTSESLQRFHDAAYPLAVQLERTQADLSAHSAHTTECLRKLPARLMTDHLRPAVPERANQTLIKMLVALRKRIADLRWHDVAYKQAADEPQSQPKTGQERHRNNSGYPRQHRHGRGQVNAARAEHKAERKPPYCALCPVDGHWPTECTTYPDTEKRWARVQQMDLCSCCLRKEQWSGQCKGHMAMCRFCNSGKHHRSLCKKYVAVQSRRHNRRDRSPPPTGAIDRTPWTGRKVKFERGSVKQKRRTYASAGDSVAQPNSNAGKESEEEELSLYDAYMSSLKPEDIPDYPDRPVISPRPDFAPEPETESSDYSDTSDSEQSSDGAAYGSIVPNKENGQETACLLECARTHIFHPVTGKMIETTVFFDGGSTHSYVHSSLAEKLNLPKLRKSRLRVHIFGTDEPVRCDGFGTRIGFHLRNGNPLVMNVNTSNHMPSNMEAVFITARDLPALKADKCAIIPSETKVEVLIGRGDFHLFKRMEPVRVPSGFEVVQTHLGYMLAGHGYISTAQSVPSARTNLATAKPESTEDLLDKVADGFWRIEHIGLESSKPNADDDTVYQRVRAETIINEEGRYEVPLVFKTPSGEPPSYLELPQQKQVAIGRLDSELRKLHKNPKILGQYKEYLEGLIDRGEAQLSRPRKL